MIINNTVKVSKFPESHESRLTSWRSSTTATVLNIQSVRRLRFWNFPGLINHNVFCQILWWWLEIKKTFSLKETQPNNLSVKVKFPKVQWLGTIHRNNTVVKIFSTALPFLLGINWVTLNKPFVQNRWWNLRSHCTWQRVDMIVIQTCSWKFQSLLCDRSNWMRKQWRPVEK